jgi:hypothetical protein
MKDLEFMARAIELAKKRSTQSSAKPNGWMCDCKKQQNNW